MATIIADTALAHALHETIEGLEVDDTTIIYLEHSLGGHARNQGLEDAAQAARSGKPVVMLGWQTERQYTESPAWHAALAHTNARFLRLPCGPDEIMEAVTHARANVMLTDPLAVRLHEVEGINYLLGTVKHNLPHAQRQGEAALETWAIQARAIFGNEISLEELIMATEDAKIETLPARMNGEHFPDYCIDAEGTLLVDGAINPDAVEAGQAAEQNGYPITVWTGGDVSKVRKALIAARIYWKVASKWLFRGVTVHAALDDEPLEQLRQKYGVEIQNFELIDQ